MILYHPKKGVVSDSKQRLNKLTNVIERFFVDQKGKEHKLDGTEMTIAKMAENARKEMETIKNIEAEMDRREEEMEEKMRIKYQEESKKDESKTKRHKEVVSKLDDVRSAIKEIPEPEFPGNDDILEGIENQTTKLAQSIQENTDKLRAEPVDLSPVVEAVRGINIPEFKIPPSKDYSKLLKEIKDNLPEINENKIIKAIKGLKTFEIPEWLISKDDRLKVEVDRAGLGGGSGGGLTATETEYLKEIADSTANNDPLVGYKITDIDGSYYGFTKTDGSWYIMFDNSGAWRYLKGDSGYTTAWTNRVGAGYDYFYNIF